MFDSITTNILQIRKKNIGSFLAVLFCTLIIASTIGTSFGTTNSFAEEQQLQLVQPSIVRSDSPWSNNLPTFDALSLPDSHAANTRNHNNVAISSSLAFTKSKNLDLNHSFVSNKVVGPDRFRFITSYWTNPDTSLGVDVGTSANNTFLAANSLPPNEKLEVDTDEGPSTLAVVLQYQGVVNLAGVTAALKLPTGYKAMLPLTSDRISLSSSNLTNYLSNQSRFDIALSSYRGHIYPSQGIVLYFSMYVTKSAKVGLPVLGPLALHFLRTDQRSISDLLDASEQKMFGKVLSVMHTGNATFPNSTFKDNFDFKRDYFNQFGRFIPYDFVNQVIPVIFKATGSETLDVVTLPTGVKDAVKNISAQIVQIPNGKSTLVRLAVRNTGDVPIWDLTVNVFPGLQSALGINGLTPSAITSPNIPDSIFSTIPPIGVVGPSFFGIGELGPNQNAEFDVSVFPTHYVAGTVQLMNVNLVYNNIIGERATQLNQVYFNVVPNP